MLRAACLLRRLLFVASVFFVDVAAVRAEEPFFKKGDVIAIVGGEDMVALSEYGYLELLLTRALPDHRLRFRNLAWEGDTVFEQRRDLNFPPWEEQLEKIGATVVLCQFGQMESLGKGEGRKAKGDGASKEEIAEFSAAYEKLLARFSGGGKRRVLVVTPVTFGSGYYSNKAGWQSGYEYSRAITDLAARRSWRFVTLMSDLEQTGIRFTPRLIEHPWITRDGVHLTEFGHRLAGVVMAKSLYPEIGKVVGSVFSLRNREISQAVELLPDDPLLELIRAKNRLWFDYWRVQNWAFLAGDRTNQPSSRDHLDPKKRWFPEERERFLPLIEAKEKEIDALAAQLAQP